MKKYYKKRRKFAIFSHSYKNQRGANIRFLLAARAMRKDFL